MRIPDIDEEGETELDFQKVPQKIFIARESPELCVLSFRAQIWNMQKPPDYRPPETVQELLERYGAGERYFAETDLPDGSDLNGAILEGAYLEFSWFHSVNFSRANLKGVSFGNCNVKCANFSQANLEGANFRGAAVESINLEGANLTGASFAGSFAYGYELKDGDTP